MPKHRVSHFARRLCMSKIKSSKSSKSLTVLAGWRAGPAGWFALTMEQHMKRLFALVVMTGTILTCLPAAAADVDWKKVDTAIGKTAPDSAGVIRFGLPRPAW